MSKTSRKLRVCLSRAKEAGYDGVEIHGAHGYFLSSSISPLYNHRTDRYGGSAEKRTTLLREVIRRVRRVIPGLHLSIKINSDDQKEGGLTEDECVQVCQLIVLEGLDSIEISGGRTIQPAIRAGKNVSYYRNAATRVGKAVSVMEEILKEGGVSYFSSLLVSIHILLLQKDLELIVPSILLDA